MAVPKKRTSMSKKGYWAAVKALSLAKSISTGHGGHECGLAEKKKSSVSSDT